MSGPVTTEDAIATVAAPAATSGPVLEITPSRTASVGGLSVMRALPRRGRRTVGAWCFLDHFGPTEIRPSIGPHPHIGLQTVTWLLEGDMLHTDSLGSEQRVRPGQLNLMTAGRGVAHAEEGYSEGTSHGVQLWIAQPDATRNAAPAFEHHERLPRVDVDGWSATVITGGFAGEQSPARADTPLVGVELSTRGAGGSVPLAPRFEHAIVVLTGDVAIADGELVRPGTLAYLGIGREWLRLDADDEATVLLIGGEPFGAEVLMWWNYVARTRDEIDEAHRDWEAQSERFGQVASHLARIPSVPPIWQR